MHKKMRDKRGRLLRDKDGRHRWHIRIKVNGRSRQKYLWAHDEAEVLAWVDEQKTGRVRSMTWDDLVGRYIEAKGLDGEVAKDYRRSCQWISDRCGPAVQDATLASFSSAILDKRAGDPAKGRTANKVRAYAHACARWAVQTGLIDRPALLDAPPVDQEQRERRPISHEDLPAYITALSPRAQAFVLALLMTGERITAIAGARRSDVGETLPVTTKGGHTRHIPVTTALRQIIDRGIDLDSHTDFIWLNDAGNPWTRYSIRLHCQRRWKKAGLPIRTIHEIRHTFGTAAASLNFNAPTIQALMGHRSPDTAKHYIHMHEAGAGVSSAMSQVQEVLASALVNDTFMTPFDTGCGPDQDRREEPSADASACITCPHCGGKVSIEKGLPSKLSDSKPLENNKRP